MRKGSDSNSVTEHAVATIGAAHLLHPAMHFDQPRDVLMADNISKDEKRAILASWASDICAIESMPAWRRYPGTERIVSYDEVLTALKALDGDDQSTSAQKPMTFFSDGGSRRRRPRRTDPAAASAFAATGKEGVAKQLLWWRREKFNFFHRETPSPLKH